MIKLIALDIDGTLFNSQGEISPLTKTTLMKAHDQGVTLMLASGRTIHGLHQLAIRNDLPLDHMIFIGSNGAVLADGQTESILFEKTVDLKVAKTIIQQLKAHPVTVMIPDEEKLYIEDLNGFQVSLELQTECLTPMVLSDLSEIPFAPNKIVLSGPQDALLKILSEMAPIYKDVATFVLSGFNYLDITAKDTDKGSALQHYCELKDIDPSEVIAFGDNHNDLGMIRYSGIGVAMDNAIEELKAVAQRIAPSNDEDGIAHVLNDVLKSHP